MSLKQKAIKKYIDISDNLIIRTNIQLIPGVGGAIDTLVFHKAGQIKERRLNQLIESLQQQFETIQDSTLDKNYIHSEDFLWLIEKTFLSYISESKQKKREYYKDLLVNSCLSSFSSFDKELLFRLLENTSMFHISLLITIGKSMNKQGMFNTSVFSEYKFKLPELFSHLNLLVSSGFVFKYTHVNMEKDGDEYHAATHDTYTMTTLGKELLSLINEIHKSPDDKLDKVG